MDERINQKLIELKLRNYLDRFSKRRHIEKDISDFMALVKKIQEHKTMKENPTFKSIINQTYERIMDIKQKTKEAEISKKHMEKLARERRSVLEKHFKKNRPK